MEDFCKASMQRYLKRKGNELINDVNVRKENDLWTYGKLELIDEILEYIDSEMVEASEE